MSANISTIAATPGFYIVEPITDDKKIDGFVLIPIVGWIISKGIVYPVSIFEVCENNEHPIMTPMGNLLDYHNSYYDIQDWMTTKNKGV